MPDPQQSKRGLVPKKIHFMARTSPHVQHPWVYVCVEQSWVYVCMTVWKWYFFGAWAIELMHTSTVWSHMHAQHHTAPNYAARTQPWECRCFFSHMHTQCMETCTGECDDTGELHWHVHTCMVHTYSVFHAYRDKDPRDKKFDTF